MATGVPPREDELNFTRTDIENLQDAMKNKKFRDMFAEYCEEVRDPANVKIYQEEMTQLEKERGYNVTFINPKAGYVIKTSVAGDRKAFINICSSEHVAKPSCNVQEQNGQRGMSWQIPYSLIPPRDDYNDKREKCVAYDVVFHPDTLRMAELNKRFRELVNQTAFDGLQRSYNIHFDNNNCRFPKSNYKGVVIPAVIRTEDPDYKPPTEKDIEELSPEIIGKLYPQRNYPTKTEEPNKSESKPKVPQKKRKTNKVDRPEFQHESDNGYTLPKYIIKQQKTIEMQDYTYNRDCKQYSAIPSHIVVEANLPLLSSTKDCVLDVHERSLNLISEKPAKYKLNVSLPYPVNGKCGTAKFDKSKHILIVTLPVIKTTTVNKDLRVDSGVESEECTGSHSEDESSHHKLVEEVSSQPTEPIQEPTAVECSALEETFLEPSLGYMFPSYTHNVLDNIVAFTFHVKNTEPDSVKVKKDDKSINIKFTTVGAGFVPVNYAATIVFEDGVMFENVSGEAWDNNVILQIELAGDVPQKFQIGLDKNSLVCENFDLSKIKKKIEKEMVNKETTPKEEESVPHVEVTVLKSETNILISSTNSEYDEDDDFDSPSSKDEITWTESGSEENRAKSILRKKNIMRSFSESSAGDIASSMDYVSSDCIPEESSYKKTVRFNDDIKKQFYRYNSSIEGQKKKNQRKKSKKRSERRKSESEAEDDVNNGFQNDKPRKSVLKTRRDSGLVDTSDAETDGKNTPLEDSVFNNNEKYNGKKDEKGFEDDFETPENGSEKTVLNIVHNAKNKNSEPTIWKSETSADPENNNEKKENKTEEDAKITCDNIKHNTALYNPENLNKGQYLEVAFKNDLIFDLDM